MTALPRNATSLSWCSVVRGMAEPDFAPVTVAVVTVSDTRTEADDRSGATIVEALETAGHELHSKQIVTDDLETIRACVRALIEIAEVDVVITTGGTGITPRDVTPEAVEALMTKPLAGFGELFRWLSFEDIGTSTIQSRATGGLCQRTLVFALPGSTGAVKLGMEKILIPQLDIRHRPCNFAQMLPRIRGEG